MTSRNNDTVNTMPTIDSANAADPLTIPVNAIPSPEPTSRARRRPRMPNTRPSTPSTMPTTTSTGIHAKSNATRPHEMAATAIPFPPPGRSPRPSGAAPLGSIMRRPSSATSAVQACPLNQRYSWRPCGSGNHPDGNVGGPFTASQSTFAGVEFVLVRHGQPEWVRDGFNVVDPPLTERGQRQASLMAEALAAEPFDEVLVSPLLRARQTAAPLYRALGIPEAVDPWLEEIRDPNWHGTPAEYAQQLYRELEQRPIDARWDGLTGGEPMRDFTARIHADASSFLAARGMKRIDHELPFWSIDEPGQADPAGRPRRDELGVHVSPARPAADAVGVGPVRVRACVGEPARGAAGPRWVHVQPDVAVERRAHPRDDRTR